MSFLHLFDHFKHIYLKLIFRLLYCILLGVNSSPDYCLSTHYTHLFRNFNLLAFLEKEQFLSFSLLPSSLTPPPVITVIAPSSTPVRAEASTLEPGLTLAAQGSLGNTRDIIKPVLSWPGPSSTAISIPQPPQKHNFKQATDPGSFVQFLFIRRTVPPQFLVPSSETSAGPNPGMKLLWSPYPQAVLPPLF